jgi:hypothetical protein
MERRDGVVWDVRNLLSRLLIAMIYLPPFYRLFDWNLPKECAFHFIFLKSFRTKQCNYVHLSWWWVVAIVLIAIKAPCSIRLLFYTLSFSEEQPTRLALTNFIAHLIEDAFIVNRSKNPFLDVHRCASQIQLVILDLLSLACI